MRKSRKNKKPLAIFKRRRQYPRSVRNLIWGNSGLRLLSRLIVERWTLRGLRVLMKWHYKKFFTRFNIRKVKRQRYYWLRLRNCLPCTRKSDRSRMGKGKGKLVGWFGNLNAGTFVIELKYTKFSVVKPLFKYFKKKFSARVQGVIGGSFKIAPALSKSHGNEPYFEEGRAFTYKKRKKYRRTGLLKRINIDLP